MCDFCGSRISKLSNKITLPDKIKSHMVLEDKRICKLCVAGICGIIKENNWKSYLREDIGGIVTNCGRNDKWLGPCSNHYSDRYITRTSKNRLYTITLGRKYELTKKGRHSSRTFHPIVNFTAPDMTSLKMLCWAFIKTHSISINTLPDDLKAIF